MREHGALAPSRCDIDGDEYGGRDYYGAIGQEPWGEEESFEAGNGSDALFFRSIQSENGSANKTLKGRNPAEQREFLLQKEMGQNCRDNDGKGPQWCLLVQLNHDYDL